jgi:hypothetical protein
MNTPRPLFKATIPLLILLTAACTEQVTTPTPADDWSKEKVIKLLTGEFKLTKVRRVVGLDTAEVILPGYQELNNKTVLLFEAPSVLNYAFNLTVGPIERKHFPAYFDILPLDTEVYSASHRISRPDLGVRFEWDESRNTVVFKSYQITFPILPVNREALLDKSSFVLYETFEAARTAKKPTNLTLVAEETDPRLGKVKYLFTVRKLWRFASDPSFANTYFYALY